MSWTGQDPGQGDPDGIAALALLLGDVAEEANTAQDRLRKLQDNATDAIWRGSSADAFRDRIDKLPGHLRQLAQSYRDAADGFTGYAASVRQIAHDAASVRAQMANAQSEQTSAAHHQAGYVPPAGATTATPNPYDQAVANAQTQLGDATAKLAALAGDRRSADARVKGALRQAHQDGMKNKSGWTHFWSAVAKVLAVVAIVLLVIAVICVVIAFPEILAGVLAADGLMASAAAGLAGVGEAAFGGWVGTAMTATGYASLGTTSALALTGDASVTDVAESAALMFGPGIVLRGAAYLRGAATVVRDGEDVIVATSGSKGAWNTELNNPRPGSTYVVDGRFTYRTDTNGRVYQSEATLDTLAKGDRSTYQQSVAGRDDRLPTDQGGHTYGAQFGAPGEAINLTAMRATLNSKGLREYYSMEQRWASAIKDGQTVNVKVDTNFTADSVRPTSYEIEYSVGGGKPVFEYFNN